MSSTKDRQIGRVERLASLDSLPIEILLMICDHIDANTLVRSLIYVNKQFYDIISDVYLWKKRVMQNFNDCEVAFMRTDTYNSSVFNWRQFAWHTELENDCWSNYKANTTSTIFKGAHFSEVDALILTEDSNRCISASRDRSICIWNTTGTVTNPIVHKANSHTGWIWGLRMYDENHFLSCSWDSNIKLWNMKNFSKKANPLQTLRGDSAILSMTSKENFIAAGLYTRKVIAYDPRECQKRLFELILHSRSIIDLCLIQDYYLVSLSEDKTLAIWDLRTHSTVKSINLVKHGGRIPMCASYYENVLFIGDSKNHMYWLDCSRGLFNILETVEFVRPANKTARRYKINCIKCTNYGSIITGGNEGIIYILTPTNPPKVIAEIKETGSEISSIDYQNDTLVVGYVNSDVQVWKKK
ncbi:WD40-repeat-containing domain,WD40 repeat, conserved site,WD40/YVTN repeat-like-containing domain,G- [Cinara cedri]|uniref:WD40-repeat-containing domain,WD40 repeat, conserved site,WD40/YVTN repeat-like-containing domain,G n=1 Tax=Cinara cedri TaxID=506608 RepID=A0A5E4MTK7_9HEMI|nr:WD40-repeat-containing domain,WD40 repeat, conserved site,WD40/YVTN repeat-like-containing domain,G- [Cinara cedri]